MKKLLSALLLIIFSLLMLVVFTARSVVGTFFSAVHSEKWIGPGVDVFWYGVSPTPGGELALEIIARGGSAAGINSVSVTLDNEEPQHTKGEGVTWSGSLSSKSVGNASQVFFAKVPSSFVVGSKHNAVIQIEYVMALGSGSFYSNDTKRERLVLAFEVVSPAWSLLERLFLILQGVGLFALACWLTARITQRASKQKTAKEDDDLLAYLVVELFLFAGFLAYWFVAWPIQRALGLHGEFFATVLVLAWSATMIFLMIRHGSERFGYKPFTLRLESQQEPIDGDPYRSQKTPMQVWVSLSELSKLFQKKGLRTRLWFFSLTVLYAGEKIKIRTTRNNELLMLSRYQSAAEKIATIIATEVGTVYFDDGSSPKTIQKPKS